MAEDQVNLIPVRRLNLIPVGLKEAGLDSPTFRATATHFGDQIDVVERWLESYLKAASKLLTEVSTLETLINSFISYSTPPTQISEAVLDHDYTLLAVQRYSEGAKEFWQHTLRGAKRFDTVIIEPIKNFLNTELKAFKDARRTMETAQKSFDSVISRYLGQNKTKEASSLREDAFQLHEARKAYLKASMDFCVLAPELRASVDKLIVKVFADQWKEMRTSREANAASFAKWGFEMERIRGWSREMENSERAFKRELAAARKQIEDNVEQNARPSRELEDYAASTVPYLGTGASSATSKKKQAQESSEKQGWLYVRSVTGRPPRTYWSRRWFFVKHGIFGWLVQGTRTGGVEESEKIGVLLCSVRPAFQEERRFCFEVKTSDASIILQAETQQELTDWISAFEVAKRKALEDPASTAATPQAPGVDPAFAISPPVAPELAAKAHDGHGASGSEDASSNLNIPDRDLAMVNRVSTDGNPGRRVMSSEEKESTREHASRIMQKLDLKRSNASEKNKESSGPAQGGIASLISASHSALPVGPGVAPVSIDGLKRSFTSPPSSSLAPSTLANPPAATNLSHTAIVVGSERGIGLGRADGTGIPSGILANLWGSSNWSYVNRLDDDISPSSPTIPAHFQTSQDDSIVMDGNVEGQVIPQATTNESTSVISHRKTMSVGTEPKLAEVKPVQDKAAHEYPNYYPAALRAQNSQFRMLFPQVPKAEKVLLVFRATWNPNEQQEFPGRVYVTARQIYFFSNHLGLVLTTSVRLRLIDEVTAAPGRDCDFLYLHLREGNAVNNARRITVKIFLESMKLLQRRLDFLVQNSREKEPLDMEAVLKKLIKLEVEVPKRSSSVESWEDVAFDANEQADVTSSPEHRRGNLKASLRIDGNLYNDPAKTGRELQKFKLPSQPVKFVPAGMQSSITRDFNLSAKALFHVIFGDKSSVFQVVYCNRWADKVAQTPWVKGENGQFARSFSSQGHSTPMADTQVIEVYNDHLCYVVTNTKHPWRLPYADRHTLITKYVVTHSAKSRAKLAIYQNVRWDMNPTFGYIKHLIERESLNALEADALDLTTVTMDQVAKLGNHSNKTNKAIDMFGGVGQSSAAVEMDSKEAPNLGGSLTAVRREQRKPMSLYRLVRNDIISKILSFISVVFDVTLALGRSIMTLCTMHTLLVGLLLVSALYNGWHGYRDGLAWYQDRNAANFMARIGVRPNPQISRTIYLHDINELVSSSVTNDTAAALSSHDHQVAGQRTCRDTFSETLALSAEAVAYPSSHTAARLSRARGALARYRHDLLVALRVVNRVERDVVLAEWDDWVRTEDRNCARIEQLVKTQQHQKKGGDGKKGSSSQQQTDAELGEDFAQYCESCRRELADISDGIELI